jgi:hypothetical protein
LALRRNSRRTRWSPPLCGGPEEGIPEKPTGWLIARAKTSHPVRGGSTLLLTGL